MPANRLGYGTPADLAGMLDSVIEDLKEASQDLWGDADVRAASEALADHLAERNERHARLQASKESRS